MALFKIQNFSGKIPYFLFASINLLLLQIKIMSFSGKISEKIWKELLDTIFLRIIATLL